MPNNSTVYLQPTTRTTSEGGWVREPGWVSPAGTVHTPPDPTVPLQARIAELEAGLRELQDTLLHDSKCLHVVYEGHCSCRYIKQTVLITSLLESR